MNVLIYYIDFHPDNYQGGSGKSFEMRYSLTIPNDILVGEIKEYILNKLSDHVRNQRPFGHDVNASIITIEII
jgi:hypothetical protein